MPETINISGLEYVNNSSYNNDGVIITAADYKRTENYTKLNKGTYIFKFIIVIPSETVRTLNFRIIRYNGDEHDMVYRQASATYEKINTILKYKVTIEEDMIVRFSYRNNVQLMEIEKL